MKAIPARPHVQGSVAGLEVETTRERLTDAAGLLPFRGVWDRLGIGKFLDGKLAAMGGRYRPALLIEQWAMLLQYGGDCMDHLPLLESRGVREMFGWEDVAHPTTFGRFLRAGGKEEAQVMEEALLRLVRARWAEQGGAPRAVMLKLDSTVVVRYAEKQAGSAVGYNPKKRGRRSHHPLLAFLDTGDCVGVRWRPGDANCAAGTEEWVEEVVRWLRGQGVERILVRLDKGFFRVSIIKKLLELKVDFVLKMQESNTLQCFKGAFREYAPDRRLMVAEGRRWGVRMLCVRQREEAPAGELALGHVVLKQQSTILTNLEGIDAVTAWRMYNQGALVEHRIEEMGQIGAGRTAVDDIGGNHLLWALWAFAYELTHYVRTVVLPQPKNLEERLRREPQAQVKSLRTLVFRAPGKLVRHARRWKLRLVENDPATKVLLWALKRVQGLRAPPVFAV